MTATAQAASFVATQAPFLMQSGQGMKINHYTVTKSTQSDTVTLADFTNVLDVIISTVATGVYTAESPYTIGTSATGVTNKITMSSTTTGTVYITAFGY